MDLCLWGRFFQTYQTPGYGPAFWANPVSIHAETTESSVCQKGNRQTGSFSPLYSRLLTLYKKLGNVRKSRFSKSLYLEWIHKDLKSCVPFLHVEPLVKMAALTCEVSANSLVHLKQQLKVYTWLLIYTVLKRTMFSYLLHWYSMNHSGDVTLQQRFSDNVTGH